MVGTRDGDMMTLRQETKHKANVSGLMSKTIYKIGVMSEKGI